MKAAAKSTLMFIFFVLLFSISGRAWNVAEDAYHSISCQVSVSSSDYNVDDREGSGLHESQSLSGSDRTFGLKPVSESCSYASSLRLRRIIESVDIHKDIMQKFCLLRESLLISDKSKSYYSDKNPHYASVSCEYYIFTLRRILI